MSRTSFSWRTVGLAFFGLLLVGVLGAVVIYFKLIRYERVAAAHVPPDATLALRVDVQHAILFEPFRKHLLPLASKGQDASPRADSLAPRPARIKNAAGVELTVDTREFVLVRGQSWDDWLVIVGGKFPRSGVLQGLHSVFTEEGMAAQLSGDGTLLTLSEGVAIAQASDGALVVAASAQRAQSALPRQPSPALDLEVEKPIALAFSGDLLTLAPSGLAGVQHVSAAAELGSPLQVHADVTVGSGADRERIRKAAQAPEIRSLLPLPSEVAVNDAGPGRLRVTAIWDRASLDRAAEQLGAWLTRAVF